MGKRLRLEEGPLQRPGELLPTLSTCIFCHSAQNSLQHLTMIGVIRSSHSQKIRIETFKVLLPAASSITIEPWSIDRIDSHVFLLKRLSNFCQFLLRHVADCPEKLWNFHSSIASTILRSCTKVTFAYSEGKVSIFRSWHLRSFARMDYVDKIIRLTFK